MYMASVSNLKNNKERQMSIEKKSLISNRSAAKKALVTKPEASKVASTKMSVTKLSLVRIATAPVKTRLGMPRIKTM
jgi:hypothetical protein